MDTIATIGIAIAAAAAAAGITLALTGNISKKRRSAILKEAEAEGEMIKKERPKRNLFNSKANTTA